MSSSPTFDLTRRPWLPVLDLHGEVPELGLRDVFLQAHELRDLAVPVPPAASGLWRILYALAARVTGLDDPGTDAKSWHERRNELLEDPGRGFEREAVEAYFDRWAGRFDLFHPQWPWLQDPRLAEQCPKTAGVDKLVMSRPAGNNQVWFDHHHAGLAGHLPANEAAWHLIAQLYYGPAGRCATRTIDGVSDATTKAGPLRGTLSYHPMAQTLHDTLLAGLVYPGALGPTLDPVFDRCPWELPEQPDPLGLPLRPAGLCSLLTARYRHALLLAPDGGENVVTDTYITWAWRQDGIPVDDPYLMYVTNAKTGTRYPRASDHSRALWRDVDALLLDNIDGRTARPEVLRQAADLPDHVAAGLRARACGFDQDGKTKNTQWFQAKTPPVVHWAVERDPDQAHRVAAAHEAAEQAHRRLQYALRVAWSELQLAGGSSQRRGQEAGNPWLARGSERFWPRAERTFWGLTFNRSDAGGRTFTDLACQVYDAITDPVCARPRAAEAVVRARRFLFPARSTRTREPA